MNRVSLFSKKIVNEIGCYDKYNQTKQRTQLEDRKKNSLHYIFFLPSMMKKRGLFVSIAAQKTDITLSHSMSMYIKKKHEDYFEFILRQKKKENNFFELILNKTRPSQILFHTTAAHQQSHIQ